MLNKIKHHWIVDAASGNIGGVTRQKPPSTPIVSLIGAPDDRGVLNVGGRLGAGHAPAAVRHLLSQFALGIEGAVERVELHQGFDVDLGPTIEAGHAAVRRTISGHLRAGQIPVLIGGGHDYGFPHAAGTFDAHEGKIAVINVDAHLDVRPPGVDGITSGSPFYLALEEGVVKPKNFVEFGIQEHCNAEPFHCYLKSRKVEIQMLEKTRAGRGVAANFEKLLTRFERQGLKTVVSFDVDAIQMAHAPGVSAPQCDGFTPGEFFEMARLSGESRAVATVGFFELAPSLDEHGKTTRLVTTALHRFLSGVSRRDVKKSRRRIVRRLLPKRRS